VLRGNHQRILRAAALPYGAFGVGNLFGGAAEVQGAGAAACRVRPGDGGIQCPIHLEGARPVAVSFQSPSVPARETAAADAQQFPWRHVAQHHAVPRQVRQGVYPCFGLNPAAVALHLPRKGIGDAPGSSARKGPAGVVGCGSQGKRESRAGRVFQAQPGMAGDPRQQGGSLRRTQPGAGPSGYRPQRLEERRSIQAAVGFGIRPERLGRGRQ